MIKEEIQGINCREKCLYYSEKCNKRKRRSVAIISKSRSNKKIKSIIILITIQVCFAITLFAVPTLSSSNLLDNIFVPSEQIMKSGNTAMMTNVIADEIVIIATPIAIFLITYMVIIFSGIKSSFQSVSRIRK